MPRPIDSPIRRVAVIGAGTIGASWAACFLAKGLEVIVSDPAPTARDLTARMIETAWPILRETGAATGAPAAWRFEPDPVRAVEGADFVQENGPERYEVKQPLFKSLDAALPPQTVIASSSSGLLVSKLAEDLRHPERCLIGHPFNPPHLIPLVEVVGGKDASEAAIETAMAFYRSIGKRPIRINKEVPGHIANRLQAALWREAVHLVAEGVASVADVDAAISEGPGLRWALMGPHATFHLGGGEGGMKHFFAHIGPAVESWWADLGAPKLTPEIAEKVTAGVVAETGGLPIAELAAKRDAALVRLLQAKSQS
jgi:3-hydroxyacyl-CoA dehydrogenase